MVFSSALFLLYFLPLFLLVYHIVGERWKNGVILLFSLFFYSWGAPRFVFVLLALTGIDFFIVRKMYGTTDRKRKKAWLAASVCINMGLLFYFKYSNFFIETVNTVLSVLGFHSIHWTKLILPIGISFFTFETLTYSIDAYRGIIRPLKRLPDYYLYIFLFPKLIAGPIVRFTLIEDQMHRRTVLEDDLVAGFLRFCLGLGKKVLIANTMGRVADELIAAPEAWDMAVSWTALLAYTFQIYFDFSGYSDMALGIGRMIGFRFPENFDNPYTSSSITEFWRRWHMTLGFWMREYLYIPLGGNRVKSKTRLYFNLWVVFLLSGLWHGASWNFVVWGAYHGCFLVLDRMFLLRWLENIPKAFSVALTFFLVAVGWAFFRIEDFQLLGNFLQALFSFRGQLPVAVLDAEVITTFLIGALFAFFIILPGGKLIQQCVYYPQAIVRWRIPVLLGAAALLGVSLAYITTSNFNPFIYFRF